MRRRADRRKTHQATLSQLQATYRAHVAALSTAKRMLTSGRNAAHRVGAARGQLRRHARAHRHTRAARPHDDVPHRRTGSYRSVVPRRRRRPHDRRERSSPRGVGAIHARRALAHLRKPADAHEVRTDCGGDHARSAPGARVERCALLAESGGTVRNDAHVRRTVVAHRDDRSRSAVTQPRLPLRRAAVGEVVEVRAAPQPCRVPLRVAQHDPDERARVAIGRHAERLDVERKRSGRRSVPKHGRLRRGSAGRQRRRPRERRRRLRGEQCEHRRRERRRSRSSEGSPHERSLLSQPTWRGRGARPTRRNSPGRSRGPSTGRRPARPAC